MTQSHVTPGFHGSGKWLHFTPEDVWLETERGYHKYFVPPPKPPPPKRPDPNSIEAKLHRKEVRKKARERARLRAKEAIEHKAAAELQREIYERAKVLASEREAIIYSLALAKQRQLLDEGNVGSAIDFAQLEAFAARKFVANEQEYRASHRAHIARISSKVQNRLGDTDK